jgi:hypothetical protein
MKSFIRRYESGAEVLGKGEIEAVVEGLPGSKGEMNGLRQYLLGRGEDVHTHIQDGVKGFSDGGFQIGRASCRERV